MTQQVIFFGFVESAETMDLAVFLQYVILFYKNHDFGHNTITFFGFVESAETMDLAVLFTVFYIVL